MQSSRSKLHLLAAALGLCALALAPTVRAQDGAYPSKPVRVIVPFPAGGLVDGITRTLMTEIAKSIGQPVLIDNRGGAGGSVGAAAVAQAPADGYTLLMVLDSHAINPLVYKKLPYNTDKDFAPISLVARAPMVIVANSALPVNSVTELVQYAKANPGVINFASVGAGSASHLTAELFNAKADISTTHVPYKGGAPAQTDLMSGQVQIMWGTAPYAQGLVKSGRIKALGQASAVRSVAFPTLPTLAEQGVAGFETYGWIGLLAPAGTPASVVAFWNAQLVKTLKQPAVAQRLTDQGFELVGGSPEQFGAFIRSEQKTWEKLIATRNIPLQ